MRGWLRQIRAGDDHGFVRRGAGLGRQNRSGKVDAARAGRTRRLPGHSSRQLGRRTAQAQITGAAHVIRELTPVAGSGGPLSRRRRLRTRRAPFGRTGLQRTALRHARPGHGEGRGRQPVPLATAARITLRDHIAPGQAARRRLCSGRGDELAQNVVLDRQARPPSRHSAWSPARTWFLASCGLASACSGADCKPGHGHRHQQRTRGDDGVPAVLGGSGRSRRHVRTAAVSACSQSTGQETVAARPRG